MACFRAVEPSPVVYQARTGTPAAVPDSDL